MTARRSEFAQLGRALMLMSDLASLGPPDAVRRRVGMDRMYRGVFAHVDTDRSLAARIAVFLRGLPPGSVAYGVAALQLYGIRIGPAYPLHLATTSASQTRRTELRISRIARLPEPDSRGWLTPPDALTSAAHQLDLLQLVTAADWLVELGLAPREELVDDLTAMTGRACRLGRRAAPMLGDRVRSPRETWVAATAGARRTARSATASAASSPVPDTSYTPIWFSAAGASSPNTRATNTELIRGSGRMTSGATRNSQPTTGSASG